MVNIDFIKSKINKPEKIKNFTLKIYNKSDYNDLMDLYNKVFPGYMSKELWLWKTKKNPFGNFYNFLMKNGDDLIGSYTVAPMEFYILGKKCPCVQSMDTMIKKNYERMGISTYLANITYEYVKEQGKNFVYGFPNKNSSYMFFNKLNWTDFGKIQLLYKEISNNSNNLRSQELNKKYFIKEIDQFKENINELWENYKSAYLIILKKDKSYLNWRFDNHPLIKYNKFLVINEKEDKIIAYFVLKKYKDKNGEIIGHIVDYIISYENGLSRENIFVLIETFSYNFFKEECSKISFWMFDKKLREFVIKHLNYSSTEVETYLGVRILNEDKDISVLKSIDKWHITMSNNDVF